MEALSLFNRLVREHIRPLLSLHGYKRYGNTYLLYKDEIWRLINFQKSTKSTRHEVLFTINLGISSQLLYNFYNETIKRPKIEDCHFRERIGFLLPQHKDKWWTINANSNLVDLNEEIFSSTEHYIVPELEKYSSNSNLRDLWISGRSPGLTDFKRLMNLMILLKEIGPTEMLEQVIEELRLDAQGTPAGITAEIYIDKILKSNR